MDLSVFEISGPPMIGSSSAHTAGAGRIGWVALSFVLIAGLLAPVTLLAQSSATASPTPAENVSDRAPLLECTSGNITPFRLGTKLFSNRSYLVREVPKLLNGAWFLYDAIDRSQTLTCRDAGTIYALVPLDHSEISWKEDMSKMGFAPVDQPPFELFRRSPADKVTIFRKDLAAGEQITTKKWIVLLAKPALRLTRPGGKPWASNDGELLYNGIRLPREWPPVDRDPSSFQPMPVPYLDAPPAVVPIDVGRQLFVDDFLIERTDLARTWHRARKYEGNPVLKPETPSELNPPSAEGAEDSKASTPFHQGGVFYHPEKSRFEMFYGEGVRGGIAFATSKDLIHWERPKLGLAGGNLIIGHGWEQAGGDNSMWLDLAARDLRQRYKMILQRRTLHTLHTSPDGLTWSPGVSAGKAGDYSSFFYNPFRGVWVQSSKQTGPRGRSRAYSESRDFLAGADRNKGGYWTSADELDQPDPAIGNPAQLYSLSAVAYESVLLGEFLIHLGPSNSICTKGKFPKLTEIKLGFSRDGFHWSRPDREPFIGASKRDGAYDRGYLHGTAGALLIMGDELWFPFSSYSGVAPDGERGIYVGASISMAILRRDGFASMDAAGKKGALLTRPVTFSGKKLFVNAVANRGSLRAEIRDEQGRPIAPFTLENSVPFSGDSTLANLQWKGAEDLSALAGKPVRFFFELTDGSLYSFWVSRDETGRSDGYVAAGGPGYTGPIDTVGRAALRARMP